MNKRAQGTKYEQFACEYLKNKGYNILEINFRCKLGEIDIIAKDNEYLVFIEVKYRSTRAYGFGQEAVDYRKQQIITKCAQVYLKKCGLSYDMPIRFDVIAFNDKEVDHIENAFGA